MSPNNQNNDNKKPPFDWMGQLRYFALVVVSVVAVMILMRFLGLRG